MTIEFARQISLGRQVTRFAREWGTKGLGIVAAAIGAVEMGSCIARYTEAWWNLFTTAREFRLFLRT
jgi:hypothetical protein